MNAVSDIATPLRNDADPQHIVRTWLERFNAAIEAGDETMLSHLFRADSHWRNVLGIDWSFATITGRETIVPALVAACSKNGARNFVVDENRTQPFEGQTAGEPTIDAILNFETSIGTGIAHLRVQTPADGEVVAWTLMTFIDSLKGHDLESERLKRERPAYERDWSGPNWADKRRESGSFADRDPQVLVVGGGHGGLTAAAWLKALNIETLVVDRIARIGDNWRNRYNALKLHSPTNSVHFPFIPFPDTWPRYIPKDKIANWMEFYVDAMEIDFWTSTSFEGADYDEARGRWNARLKLADGSIRVLHPTEIIMATSQNSVPVMPRIPTIEHFSGPVLHSSQFSNGHAWAGKNVLVFGTGTSGHDLSQELHSSGANVTMVQRGETEIVEIEPTAGLYVDHVFEGDGPPLEERDLLFCSLPAQLVMQEHQKLTRIAHEMDRPLLDGLRKVGFKLDSDPDSFGWVFKGIARGGGYYFNVGGSNLLVNGDVGLIQYEDIVRFDSNGLHLADGRFLPCDLVIMATGYKGVADLLQRLFGEDVTRRVGQVWGFDPDRQELANMWVESPQKGLWFAGGTFTHSRIFSKYLAIQIKAKQLGIAS